MRLSPARIVTFCMLTSFIQSGHAWFNNFNGNLDFSCDDQYGGGIFQILSYHHNHNEDRRWWFACVTYGSLSSGTMRYTGLQNNWDSELNFECPTNFFLAQAASYHDNHRQDRRWSFGCRPISGASLSSCAWTAYQNNWDGNIGYDAPERFAITGLNSYHDNFYEDRRWKVRACRISCDRNNGFIDSGDFQCKRVTCGHLFLSNGVLAGSCGGAFGDKCEYRSCHDGYEFVGFGSSSRSCGLVGDAGQWSGSARECKDINECQDDSHDCVSPAVCVNTVGGFKCSCPYGNLDEAGKACDVVSPQATVSSSSSSITLDIHFHSSDSFSEYEFEIGEWSLDLSTVNVLPGYPTKFSRSNAQRKIMHIKDLNAGRRFQVRVTPLESNGNPASSFEYVGGTSAGDIATHCGCDNVERSGEPDNFDLRQERGLVLFEWRDRSMCESGFSFFRNDVSLSATYDVTSKENCDGEHEPLSVNDDLQLQKEDIYKPILDSEHYLLPQGRFFLRVMRAAVGNAERFAYPSELVIGDHFITPSTSTSTSTTTTPTTTTSTTTTTFYQKSTSTSTATKGDTTTYEPDDGFSTTTTSTTTGQKTTLDLEVGPPKKVRAERSVAEPKTNGRAYPTGVSTIVSNARECPVLCNDLEWCVGFVVQHLLDGTRICHQLKLLRIAHLDEGIESAADSYELVNADGDYTTVNGEYIFEGSDDACQKACSDTFDCVMVSSGPGYCAWAKEMIATSVDPSILNERLSVTSRYKRHPGASPGTNLRYCVAATNPVDYTARGYYSKQACDVLNIAWESVITGQVVIDSDEIHLPVEGVTVTATMDGVYSSTVITGEDGVFEFHVRTHDLRKLRQRMTLSYFKLSGSISHSFSCGGVACTEQTVIVEHLKFDHTVEVRDTTSVPFSGRVTIAGTEHNGFQNGCPLRDVEVCLYDRLHGERELGCAVTSAQGYYTVPAVLGSSVGVRLRYGNTSHAFARAPYEPDAPNAPSGQFITTDAASGLDKRIGFYDIVEGAFYESIDFKDVSSDRATVDVAGGMCNYTLGNAILEFRYDSCPTWIRTEQTSSRISKWNLPAQIISVRFQRLVRKGEVREEMTRYFSATLGNSRIIHVDLRDPENKNETIKTARFEYHAPPQLAIKLNTEMSTDCKYDSDGSGMRIIPMNAPTNATVVVTEDYGADIGVCDIVPGVVLVTNQLGESPTVAQSLYDTSQISAASRDRLQRCYEGCNQVVVMDTTVVGNNEVPSNSHVTVTVQTGSPQTNPEAQSPDFPYTKLFAASMHSLPHDPVEERVFVVVTGQQAKSSSDSFAFPRYQPLLVVQDPPGGLSTASYSDSYASFSMRHESYAAYGGFFLGLEVTPFRVDAKLDLCIGLGAANCINLVTAKTEPVVIKAETTNMFGGKSAEDNNEKEQTWMFKIDVSTSDEPMLAGQSSDMFLVPALNVIFLLTDVIAFDSKTCKVSKTQTSTWSLNSDKNREVFTWLSDFEIRNKEIPTLVAQKALTTDVEKQTELQDAIDAWQKNLDDNADVRNRAKLGTLDSVQKLWSTADDTFKHADVDPVSGNMDRGIAFAPHDAIDSAVGTDGVAADGNDKDKLRAINTVKFSGGGSTYTFEYEYEMQNSVEETREREHEFKAGAAFSFEFGSSGIGAKFQIEPLGIGKWESDDGETEGFTKTKGASFTLGDADPKDVFVVDVFKHPLFNTLVFHTTGTSSCPNEAGTDPLEIPGLSLLKWPLAPVLPNEPAVYELLVRNDADDYTDLNLFMLNEENQDGITVRVNGEPLAGPIDLEGFPGQSARRMTLILERGPSKYKYDPIPIGIRSLCEADRHPDNGYLNDEVTSVVYVYPEAEFLQPCSPVQLVGEIGETGEFVVNAANDEADTRPGQLRIVAFNPDFATRTWQEDDRLEEVVIEYKPSASHVWLVARDQDSEPLDIKLRENDYGYVTAWWNVAPLSVNGQYDLRIRAQCTASINEVPPGIDENLSRKATGFIDREAPVVLGYPAPADGEYKPGDDIAFAFDEPIQCTKPFWFRVEMKVDGLARDFNNDNMVIICRDNMVRMSLRRGFEWTDVAGKSATVTIEELQDLYGNVPEQAPTHTFRFAVIEVSALSVKVSGIQLTFPYKQEYIDRGSEHYANLTADIQNVLSQQTGLALYRIQVASVLPADISNFNAGIIVSVYLLPADPGAAADANGAGADRRRRADADADVTAADAASMLISQARNSTASAGSALFGNSTNVELEYVETGHGGAAPTELAVASVAQSNSSMSNEERTLYAMIALILLVLVLQVSLHFQLRRKRGISYNLSSPSFHESSSTVIQSKDVAEVPTAGVVVSSI